MKYYEAVRNLRGKNSFCPPYWILWKKAAYHSAGSNVRDFWLRIINIFKILIEFGWFFSDKGALPGGPF